MADVEWSVSDETLCPGDITVELIAETETAGRSLTGSKQFVQADAGFWRIVLHRLRIRSNEDILAWRARKLAIRGRARTVLVPLYDRKRAPIPPDGSPIVATASATAVRGAVTVAILMTNGAAPEAGMHFSTSERAYRIREVISQIGSVYTVKVRPPLREEIPSSAPLEFDNPVCRCRVETDGAMNITLDLMQHATPTVPFVEDV